MNAKQYNDTIGWTLRHSVKQSDDSLTTARTIFNNLAVALPCGNIEQVYGTIKTNDYMGWRLCTAAKAQSEANKGFAAIGINENKIVIIEAVIGEVTLLDGAPENAFVKTLSEVMASQDFSDLEFYYYCCGTTTYYYEPLTCYQTKNDCYVAAKPIGTVKGIVVHSTGANNKTLKRYIDYPEKLGTNAYGNHWNQSGINKMVHAFIGVDKNNEIAIVNTLPYSYECWGVGSGDKGSYNKAPNGHIQFEICEDNKTDINYFNNAVFGAAVEYCAYLCRRFNLSVDSIVSHKEAHEAGYGSNHGDPDYWLAEFGKTMDDFRDAVRVLIA